MSPTTPESELMDQWAAIIQSKEVANMVRSFVDYCVRGKEISAAELLAGITFLRAMITAQILRNTGPALLSPLSALDALCYETVANALTGIPDTYRNSICFFVVEKNKETSSILDTSTIKGPIQ